jgi:hypothetical protein
MAKHSEKNEPITKPPMAESMTLAFLSTDSRTESITNRKPHIIRAKNSNSSK